MVNAVSSPAALPGPLLRTSCSHRSLWKRTGFAAPYMYSTGQAGTRPLRRSLPPPPPPLLRGTHILPATSSNAL